MKRALVRSGVVLSVLKRIQMKMKYVQSTFKNLTVSCSCCVIFRKSSFVYVKSLSFVILSDQDVSINFFVDIGAPSCALKYNFYQLF